MHEEPLENESQKARNVGSVSAAAWAAHRRQPALTPHRLLWPRTHTMGPNMPSRFIFPALTIVVSGFVTAAPTHLRCDYRDNPIGIDNQAPRLSWQSDNTGQNWTQSAYQILVASDPDLIRRGKPDIWDSRKQRSSKSVDIAYGGPKLETSRRYYWTVRVWDAKNIQSTAGVPAFFETGLLVPTDWTAKWITRDDAEAAADRAAIRWIWVPGQDAFDAPPSTTAVFRLHADVPAIPQNAALYLLARVPFTASVNGHPAGRKDGRFRSFDRQDITDFLIPGRNTIEVTLTTPPADPATPHRTAAFAALLKVTNSDGIVRFPTSDIWQVRTANGTDWQPASVIAELSDERMKPDPGPLPGPASLFRREFAVSKSVKSARLYATALGSYQAFINGTRIGADILTPEYTNYSRRVTYQTYDVTSRLHRGPNAIGAMLGDGWFASGSTWYGLRFSFLSPPTRLLAQLRIDYTDGTHEIVATDENWTTAQAPILASEIYAGETYDARLEQPGWDQPAFNHSGWTSAKIAAAPPAILSAEVTTPPRVVETLHPKSVAPGANGTFVVDMGQNMVGWVQLKPAGPTGTKIRLRFAEILNPDGSIYTDNLRNADQTDNFYTGKEARAFEPHFTFHGFRYVELSGYPGTPQLDTITGQVISSAQQLTGKLSTASDLVNRMWQIGIWGQRGNFLSIPTDCPQRDERLGWMGDAQVFWRTGAYNADIAAFGRKWVRDVRDAQSPEGAFSDTSPAVSELATKPGAPGWGDAGVIVPWTAWQQYGDTQMVRDSWESMQRWLQFIADANPDFIRRNQTGNNYADWLAPGSKTPPDLIATAYWALMARMMSQMAAALDNPADAGHYKDVYAKVQAAFQKQYIKDTGEIGTGSQTSYVLALHAGLVPDSLKSIAVDNLVKDIQAHDWHLTTGFLGTPPLLFVLADNGHADVAYRLLLNQTYPSWGYMLSKGATTWWERWNGDTGDPAMNSYNHYAFGSVMAFVYRYVAGIDTAPDAPGFHHIVIHPHPDARMPHAHGEYDSVYGKIVTDWTASPFSLNITIPANTNATVYLPTGIKQVGSGTYHFE